MTGLYNSCLDDIHFPGPSESDRFVTILDFFACLCRPIQFFLLSRFLSLSS